MSQRSFDELRARLTPERQARALLISAAMLAHIEYVERGEHIQQQDTHGCLVACLAMATGDRYESVREWFTDRGEKFAGGGGITVFEVEAYLGERGFAYRRYYRWLPGNTLRTSWPTPPFAPIHIVGVNGAGRHGVVMLHDGTVLDPSDATPRSIESYSEVAYVIGVWRVTP